MLISKNTLAIVKYLAGNDDRYISQVAKELGISVSSAHQILKQLEVRGVVKSHALGTAILYTLDTKKRETQLILELAALRGVEAEG